MHVSDALFVCTINTLISFLIHYYLRTQFSHWDKSIMLCSLKSARVVSTKYKNWMSRIWRTSGTWPKCDVIIRVHVLEDASDRRKLEQFLEKMIEVVLSLTVLVHGYVVGIVVSPLCITLCNVCYESDKCSQTKRWHGKTIGKRRDMGLLLGKELSGRIWHRENGVKCTGYRCYSERISNGLVTGRRYCSSDRTGCCFSEKVTQWKETDCWAACTIESCTECDGRVGLADLAAPRFN